MGEEEREEKQEIWSWGAGTDGQLGTTKLVDQLSPQRLSLSIPAFSLISCGGAHVLALTPRGKVMSWGRGESGQLGHDGHNNNNNNNKCLYPKFVHSLDGIIISHISAGWNHSGFVSDTGRVLTCGDGSFGQLGHGDYRSYNTPKEVSFFSSKHVQQIACGMRHSLVLLKGDQIYGFGAAKRSQLGVSKDKINSSSLPKPCFVFDGSKIVSVFANGDHSASLTDDGKLYTWGRGFNRSPDVSIPLALPASLNIKQVALGWNHALLLTDDRQVYMLGGNHHGILGEPEKMIYTRTSSSDSVKPCLSKVPGLDGKQVVQIAAGAEHSAIVTENGEIWTWGWGEHGQLGLGNTSDYVSPQLVNIGRNFGDDNHVITRVYCGSGFTFALKTICKAHDRLRSP